MRPQVQEAPQCSAACRREPLSSVALSDLQEVVHPKADTTDPLHEEGTQRPSGPEPGRLGLRHVYGIQGPSNCPSARVMGLRPQREKEVSLLIGRDEGHTDHCLCPGIL